MSHGGVMLNTILTNQYICDGHGDQHTVVVTVISPANKSILTFGERKQFLQMWGKPPWGN